jgi:hypothetical protein
MNVTCLSAFRLVILGWVVVELGCGLVEWQVGNVFFNQGAVKCDRGFANHDFRLAKFIRGNVKRLWGLVDFEQGTVKRSRRKVELVYGLVFMQRGLA